MFFAVGGKGMGLLTEKEMHKLSRQDLLQMLLSQVREVSRLKESVSQLEARAAQQEETIARLKQKLDDKDAQLEKLRGRLDEKDALLEKLGGRLDEKDAAIRTLNGEMETVRAGRDREIEERLEGFRAADRTMRERLSEKDAFIEELRARLRVQEQQIEDLRGERDDLRAAAPGERSGDGENVPAALETENGPAEDPEPPARTENVSGSMDWNEFSKTTSWGSPSQRERRKNTLFRSKEKK